MIEMNAIGQRLTPNCFLWHSVTQRIKVQIYRTEKKKNLPPFCHIKPFLCITAFKKLYLSLENKQKVEGAKEPRSWIPLQIPLTIAVWQVYCTAYSRAFFFFFSHLFWDVTSVLFTVLCSLLMCTICDALTLFLLFFAGRAILTLGRHHRGYWRTKKEG